MVNDDAIVGIVVESMSNLDMLKEQHNREVEELKNEINDLKNKVCHRPFRCPRLSCRSRLSCRPSRYPHPPMDPLCLSCFLVLPLLLVLLPLFDEEWIRWLLTQLKIYFHNQFKTR